MSHRRFFPNVFLTRCFCGSQIHRSKNKSVELLAKNNNTKLQVFPWISNSIQNRTLKKRNRIWCAHSFIRAAAQQELAEPSAVMLNQLVAGAGDHRPRARLLRRDGCHGVLQWNEHGVHTRGVRAFQCVRMRSLRSETGSGGV